MAKAVALVINPNNPAQRYRLWSTGKIDAIGGAPVPTGNPTWFNSPVGEPARALSIVNWTTPSGYVLDFFGAVHTFGGATAPSSQAPSSNPYPYYVDFSMNPAGNGQGVVLAQGGASFGIGGSATPPQFSLGALAKKIIKDWPSGKGFVLDGYGGRHPFGGAATVSGPYWNGFDIARDIVVTDWTTIKGYVLTGWGSVHPTAGAPAAGGGPYWQGADSARELIVVSTNPLTLVLMAQNGNIYDWIVSAPPTLTAGGSSVLPANPTIDTTRPTLAFDYFDVDSNAMAEAELVVYYSFTTLVDEVQTLVLTGAPTSFKIQCEGYTTAAIASGANAATVQAALRLLPTLGSVVVAGTTMAAGMTVTFLGPRSGSRQLLLVGTGYVGGTNPDMTVTRTTPGTNVFASQFIADNSVFYKKITSPTQRAFAFPEDIPNNTYKLFVRGKDSAGDQSGATMWQWVQNVVFPATPTLIATDRGGTDGIAIVVNVTSPPAGALVHIQYADDYDPAVGVKSGTWQTLRDADKTTVIVTGSTIGIREPGMGIRAAGVSIRPSGAGGSAGISVQDAEALFGVVRYYRAYVYTPTPYLSSQASTPVAATLSKPAWIISDPQDPLTQMAVTVVPPFDFTRPAAASVFYPVGRENAVVVRDGGLKGLAATLTLRVLSSAKYNQLVKLLETPSELFLRDVFGRGWYFEVVQDVQFSHFKAAPVPSEDNFLLRSAHEIQVNIVEVDRPPVTDPDPFATFFVAT